MIPAAAPAAGACADDERDEDSGKRARTVPLAPPEETDVGAPKLSVAPCVVCRRLHLTLDKVSSRVPCPECAWHVDLWRNAVPLLSMGTDLFDAALYLIE